MNQQPDLLDIIAERDTVSAAVDEEFEAFPTREMGRRLYDWNTRSYRWVRAYDLGAKRTQARRNDLDSAGIYSRGRKSSRPRAAPNRDAIYAYVQANGPCMVKNIHEDTGIPIGTIRNALHDAREKLKSYRDPAHTGSGKRVLWEWAGEKTE